MLYVDMIRSDSLITIPIPYITSHWGGGRRVATEMGGGGGVSGLNDKPNTNSHPYLTNPYTGQGFQNKFLTGCNELPGKEHIRKYISFFIIYVYHNLYGRESLSDNKGITSGSPVYGEVLFLPTNRGRDIRQESKLHLVYSTVKIQQQVHCKDKMPKI
jgi:hypothetical protein